MKATFWAALRGELQHIRKQRALLLVLLGLPVLYPVIFSTVYLEDTVVDRPTLVVDHDGSSAARRLTLYLDATQGLRVDARASSVQAGLAALERREAEVLVYIPADFDDRVGRGERAPLKVWIYAANVLTYGAAYSALVGATGQLDAEIGAEFWMTQGHDSDAAYERMAPIATDQRLLFHPRGSYGAFMVPGMLLIVVQQLVLIGSSLSLGQTRERLRPAAGPRLFAHLCGVGAAQLAYTLAGASLVVFGAFGLVGWPAANLLTLYALFAAFTLTVTPLGLVIARFVRDRYGALELLVFASIPLFMLSGYAVPREQMPEWVQVIAAALPTTPAMAALEVLAFKTSELSAVIPYLGWMALLSCAYLLLLGLVSLVPDRREQKPTGPNQVRPDGKSACITA